MDSIEKTKIFVEEQTQLFNSHEHGNYLQDPIIKLLRHTNLERQAALFESKTLPINSMLECVRCNELSDWTSMHPGWTHAMFSMSRPPHNEKVFQTTSITSGSMVLLCVDQKNFLYMNDLICKFTIPGCLILDCCTGIFLVSLISKTLPQPIRLSVLI